jgi:outer membrane protein assembly factor BamE (lipoprotein component of BamABCDE complex)
VQSSIASKKIVKLLTNTSLAVLLATGVAGCSREIEHRGYQPRAQDMQQLRLGASSSSATMLVILIIGFTAGPAVSL